MLGWVTSDYISHGLGWVTENGPTAISGTDGQKQRLLPLPYGRGHNKTKKNFTCRTEPTRCIVWIKFR